ncbi:hypothetical protein BS78_01G490100 [Paspalum vaginatum]|nr:hypothetical protein BS78_01G490100 [Paspalum vaginatum]
MRDGGGCTGRPDLVLPCRLPWPGLYSVRQRFPHSLLQPPLSSAPCYASQAPSTHVVSMLGQRQAPLCHMDVGVAACQSGPAGAVCSPCCD